MQTELAAQAITDPSLTWTVVVAFAISLITVFALIFGRYEIRLRRLRLIRDYVKTFPVIDLGEEGTSPSFEFVRSKYAADVSSDDEREVRASSGNLRSAEDIISEINDTISSTRVFLNRGDLRLLTAAIPYLLVVTTGFILALAAFAAGFAVRPFGGMKIERTWYAADKTGFHMLHTLFQTSLKYTPIVRYDEWFVTRLLVDDGRATSPRTARRCRPRSFPRGRSPHGTAS